MKHFVVAIACISLCAGIAATAWGAQQPAAQLRAIEGALNTSVYSSLDPASAASIAKRLEQEKQPREAAVPSQPGRRDPPARRPGTQPSLSYLRASGHAATLEAIHGSR